MICVCCLLSFCCALLWRDELSLLCKSWSGSWKLLLDSSLASSRWSTHSVFGLSLDVLCSSPLPILVTYSIPLSCWVPQTRHSAPVVTSWVLGRGGPASPGPQPSGTPEMILTMVSFILVLGCLENCGQLWERTGLCYCFRIFKQILFLDKVKKVRFSKLDTMKTTCAHSDSYFL